MMEEPTFGAHRHLQAIVEIMAFAEYARENVTPVRSIETELAVFAQSL
jgi:hypothetical protein